MTNAQVTALEYGFIGFLVVWATILIPQLIGQLARHGRFHLRGILTTAAVTLYACMALAVVMLPLPGPNSPRLSQTVQLHPFQWILDIHEELAKHGLPVSDWFTTQTFQQAMMNVLLFVPLGVFARVLWRRGLIGTSLIGFAASLLIEITQLTANFGTAPFVYRIFDVDDLMMNTTGAMAGWVFGALLLTLRKTPAATTSAIDAQPARRERVHLAQTR
ncbi:VanZ family protein [Amycolatopsis sp. NPDC059021]|uniref:VanZ family protein n=1 Tax=Amycolatopsis sp. NPDC059021 TaxID=3346704 RepID=UPI00366CB217